VDFPSQAAALKREKRPGLMIPTTSGTPSRNNGPCGSCDSSGTVTLSAQSRAAGATAGSAQGDKPDGTPTLSLKSSALVRSGRSSRLTGDQTHNPVMPVPAPVGTRRCNSLRYRSKTALTRS
jgi:hypothetical protein